jgi:Methane oxygenase PmoA
MTLTLSRALADWQRDDTSITWLSGTNIVWRFSFDPTKGKPFFHPLSVAGGPALTNFKPEDHPWHYGLWFSWKYINHLHSTNHANYWEEDRATGQAQGKTRWEPPVIQTTPEGAATITMDLSYVNPSNQVDMTEHREITVSAPSTDGSYSIKWKAHFVVGDEAIMLDRTPMPGETNGQVNGGYAGLAFRMAGLPLSVNMLSTAGPVTNFISDRARPKADAVAFNFTEDDKPVGGLAILSSRRNLGPKPPWYLVNEAQRTFRFACAAILAPRPLAVRAGGPMDLNYCIVVQPTPWTVDSLKAAQATSFP